MRLLAILLLTVMAGCGSESVGVESAASGQSNVCPLDLGTVAEDGVCVFRGHTFEVDQHGTACAIGARFELLWVSDGATVVFALHKPEGYESPDTSWLFAATVESESTARLIAWAPIEDPDPRPLDEGRVDLSGLVTSPARGWTRARMILGDPAPFEILGCAVEFFANINPSDPAQFERFDSDLDPDTADLQAAAREFLSLF